MPQLGESVTEGTVGRWLKRPGDTVQKYEPLLEVVTDKVDSEVPAPVSGTLLEVLVPEGETVRVGTLLARIGTETPAGETPALVGRSEFLSPVVARLVAEHGIDVSRIAGSGQDGRVTKQDVLRFLQREPAGESGQLGAEQTAPPERAAPAAGPIPDARHEPLGADIELVPLTPMRRAIAEHMERSVRVAPHVTSVVEVDLSQIMSHREAQRAAFAGQGVRLTLTPYFIQAAVAGLRRAPLLNGSFSERGILLNRRIHIGMAVALDEGLLVPVIRDADEKSLLGLARAVTDLADRARASRLMPDEVQGGTFTVTNHGTSGSLFATPIINQPQAGILGVGAIVKRPVVVSQGGVDAIAIKPICYLSLTFDHRVADGAIGDAFLAAAKAALETVG
jgi:2-oxoglutarate dehydrogenase E2 component (dihydrolipoamide succinyltransferase)